MNQSRKIFLFFVLIFVIRFANADVLCTAQEKILFSAKTGKIKDGKFTANGKEFSLCANSQKEPINTLVYRYGNASKIELEYSAVNDGIFNFDIKRNDPKSVEYIIYFDRGNTRYQISTCDGMTCEANPTFLTVSQSGKKLAQIDADQGSVIDNLFGNILIENKTVTSKVFRDLRPAGSVSTSTAASQLNSVNSKKIVPDVEIPKNPTIKPQSSQQSQVDISLNSLANCSAVFTVAGMEMLKSGDSQMSTFMDISKKLKIYALADTPEVNLSFTEKAYNTLYSADTKFLIDSKQYMQPQAYSDNLNSKISSCVKVAEAARLKFNNKLK